MPAFSLPFTVGEREGVKVATSAMSLWRPYSDRGCSHSHSHSHPSVWANGRLGSADRAVAGDYSSSCYSRL